MRDDGGHAGIGRYAVSQRNFSGGIAIQSTGQNQVSLVDSSKNCSDDQTNLQAAYHHIVAQSNFQSVRHFLPPSPFNWGRTEVFLHRKRPCPGEFITPPKHSSLASLGNSIKKPRFDPGFVSFRKTSVRPRLLSMLHDHIRY